MAMIVVERSWNPPISEEEEALAAKKLHPCMELRNVRWVRSYVSLDRKRGFCQFEAPDAESVREAHRSAGVPFDSAWPTHVYD